MSNMWSSLRTKGNYLPCSSRFLPSGILWGHLQPKALLGLGICLALEMPLGTGRLRGQGTFPSPGNSDPGVTCSVCIFDGDLCGVAFMKDQKHRKAKETHCPLAWLGLCPLGCSRPVMLCMYFDTPCVQMYLPLGLEVGDCL